MIDQLNKDINSQRYADNLITEAISALESKDYSQSKKKVVECLQYSMSIEQRMAALLIYSLAKSENLNSINKALDRVYKYDERRVV